MKSAVTFEEWAGDPAREPLVKALARMLVEEKPGGGANDLVEEFRRSGYGRQVDSWISNEGPLMRISSEDVERILGEEAVDDLAVDAGLPLDEARDHLAAILPDFVGLLSPEGIWDAGIAQDMLINYMRAVTS
jgi:uncharacterized protein YidB (DUF937 family)